MKFLLTSSLVCRIVYSFNKQQKDIDMKNFEERGFGKKNHSRIVKSVNFIHNIENRYYESPKQEYPTRPKKPNLNGYSVSDAESFLQEMKEYEEKMMAYEKNLKAYKEDIAYLNNEFHEDLMDEYNLRDNPKEGKLFEIAYEHGHADGFYSVFCWYDELSQLIV